MPRPDDPLHTRRTAQLKALAQVRNTLPRHDMRTVEELFDLAAASGFDVGHLTDKQLELVDTLARTYLFEVVS